MLSSERPIAPTFSGKPYIGPLPWSVIDKRSQFYGDEAEDFVFCMRMMDTSFLLTCSSDNRKVDTSKTFGPEMFKGGN